LDNNTLASQAIQTLWLAHSNDETRSRQYRATIAALIRIEPKDEVEGMIAAQLIAAHNATMECYRRAMIADQSLEGRRDNLSQANKLSRTYAVLLDALNRYRGKGGQQKVTVEHVHVHSGGQAVVGMVQTAGGGDRPKSEDQPPAKQIAHAPQPAVWSADQEREPLPVTGDAERPLPDARRVVPGRPQGNAFKHGYYTVKIRAMQFDDDQCAQRAWNGFRRRSARFLNGIVKTGRISDYKSNRCPSAP
jgi:hypothetical protein